MNARSCFPFFPFIDSLKEHFSGSLRAQHLSPLSSHPSHLLPLTGVCTVPSWRQGSARGRLVAGLELAVDLQLHSNAAVNEATRSSSISPAREIGQAKPN